MLKVVVHSGQIQQVTVTYGATEQLVKLSSLELGVEYNSKFKFYMDYYLRKSFTLVELLVVVSVIGILAGIMISIINPERQRQRARDARRRSDLAIVSTALEQYYADHSVYPADTSYTDLRGNGTFTNGYLANPPVDPKTDTYDYCYSTNASLQTFVLCSVLEAADSSELNGVTGPCSPPGATGTTHVYCAKNPF